ncbi:hypothetical protein EUX98_g6346 [Antrodiella citrinella]|uniref:Cyanovirin-N domain-containing protein n=1 Tax=Antrodiella citrinella TaxID=2447956 RepID=A0A4V6S1T2_9APHY|nr:hypothetical protein EUX98_g6346 [Antrodiella citrinella]
MAATFLNKSFVVASIALLSLTLGVIAESHTVRFDNQCGEGSPVLIKGGDTLSNGEDYTIDGPLSSAIAYLQTELTLGNPTCPGCGSSVDISLIPPHALNVPTSFSFYDGCDGQGASCSTPDCSTAFFNPNDNQVQVACQTDNVNLLITFCGDGASASSASSSPAPSSTPQAAPSSVVAPSSSTAQSSLPPVTTPVSQSASAPVVTHTPASLAPASSSASPATSPTSQIASESVSSAASSTPASSIPVSSAASSAAPVSVAPSASSSSASSSASASASLVSEPAATPVATGTESSSSDSEPTAISFVASTPVATEAAPSASVATEPVAIAVSGTPSPSVAAPTSTSTPRKCRNSQRKREEALASRKVALKAREMYDARIRSIARHARSAYSKRSHAGLRA